MMDYGQIFRDQGRWVAVNSRLAAYATAKALEASHLVLTDVRS